MKRKWEEPKVIIQKFTPNEYISSCGVLEDGTVLYSANIKIETAWNRKPDGIEGYVLDDAISNPHKIYMGAFYHDKELLHPDSTANGHEEAEDFGEKECVREVDKSPWGYHYHFTEVTNRS